MSRVYLTNNTPIKFDFIQAIDTFKVIENINYKLNKKGEFKLVEVTKKGVSTIELLKHLSKVFKIKEAEIGYAGLKDKHATTIQYITLPKYVNINRYKNSFEITLKEIGLVSNRLKIGELKSNSFEIILKNIDKSNYEKMVLALLKIEKYGFANFFGYQRFSMLDKESNKGLKIALNGKRVKRQESKIILAAYQSKLFNEWLNRRLEISLELSSLKLPLNVIELLNSYEIPFKLLKGDLGFSYIKGKKSYQVVNNLKSYMELFSAKKFYPTGVLFGSKVELSKSLAGNIEREFIDYSFNALYGTRRAAWVWPKDLTYTFNKDKKEATLKFTLLPGSYATTLLEELLNKQLQ